MEQAVKNKVQQPDLIVWLFFLVITFIFIVMTSIHPEILTHHKVPAQKEMNMSLFYYP